MCVEPCVSQVVSLALDCFLEQLNGRLGWYTTCKQKVVFKSATKTHTEQFVLLSCRPQRLTNIALLERKMVVSSGFDFLIQPCISISFLEFVVNYIESKLNLPGWFTVLNTYRANASMLAQSRSSNQKHGNRWRSYFQFLETIDHGAAGGNDIIQGGKVKANLTAT